MVHPHPLTKYLCTIPSVSINTTWGEKKYIGALGIWSDILSIKALNSGPTLIINGPNHCWDILSNYGSGSDRFAHRWLRLQGCTTAYTSNINGCRTTIHRHYLLDPSLLIQLILHTCYFFYLNVSSFVLCLFLFLLLFFFLPASWKIFIGIERISLSCNSSIDFYSSDNSSRTPARSCDWIPSSY